MISPARSLNSPDTPQPRLRAAASWRVLPKHLVHRATSSRVDLARPVLYRVEVVEMRRHLTIAEVLGLGAHGNKHAGNVLPVARAREKCELQITVQQVE